MQENKNKDKYRLESLERVLDVLECFNQENEGLTLTELKELSGQNHTSLKRIISTLHHRNYLSQEEGSKRYRLGTKLFQLGSIVHNSMSLRNLATFHLNKLREETGYGVLLGVIINEQLIYVDKWEGRNVIRITPEIGSSRPPHFGVIGQVLMAYTPFDIVIKLLEKYPLERYTEHTITDLEEFKTRLDNIRRNGYGFAREEINRGTLGWAAPIFTFNGKIAGAAAILSPIIAVDEAKEGPMLIQKLCLTTSRISAEMGYNT